MKVSILTVFNELYAPFLQSSLIKRAREKNLIDVQAVRFADCAQAKERIDEPTCGPGSGMLIKPDIVQAAVNQQEKVWGKAYKIFFSPTGCKLDQRLLAFIAKRMRDQECNHLMLFAARYEGMDYRVEQEYADQMISIGDYVLMGGDLPALVFLEGFLRLMPGVVGKQESVTNDSFTGPFVDYPQYCLPAVWHDRCVPPILLSGNHRAIAQWRMSQAIKNTVLNHFNWLRGCDVTADNVLQSQKYIPAHYVVLMHSQVMIGSAKQVGTSSVTPLDIHDIARSARTYGIKRFFIVTPLVDQRAIVQQLLDFWCAGTGIDYNPSRHEAMEIVKVCNNLDEVTQAIEHAEGKKPLVVATSARKTVHARGITFYDQQTVWSHERPVLIMLGTAQGLAPEAIENADFLLYPIRGFSAYNHLSVRSAAAIIFDRWLGVQEKNITDPLSDMEF